VKRVKLSANRLGGVDNGLLAASRHALQIAEAKKQELFLRNCDPVRVVQQQQNLQAVVAAREEQLQIKQRRHQHEQAVDRMYDQLWLEDKRAKDAKAQRDAETAKQRTLAQHDVLVQQRTAVEEAREREQVFKMEEERLRQQEAELMVQEQQREQEQALRKRQQMRSELNAHNKCVAFPAGYCLMF
jgi:hypothetical protein